MGGQRLRMLIFLPDGVSQAAEEAAVGGLSPARSNTGAIGVMRRLLPGWARGGGWARGWGDAPWSRRFG